MSEDPKLYPLRDGRKLTEEEVLELYKYEDPDRLTCKLVQDFHNICPRPAKDGITCHYCIAAPINYKTILKKHNIQKIKGAMNETTNS
jgi:hypothetical protein